MALLQYYFSKLKPLDKCLTDKVVLAQAWKKAQSYIRSTNSYADNFELDRSTISLSSQLEEWKKELSSNTIELTPLRLVPSPKTGEWLKNKGTEFKSVIDITTLKDVLNKRLGEQKKMYCQLSQMPAYVEDVDLGWDKNKKNLHVVMVQSLMPLKSDFITYGLTLDHPKYRAKHRKHVASVAELILHKVHSQTTAKEKRTDGIDLIIWPELAVHSDDTDILKRLSNKTGSIIFTGLNFITQKGINGPNNVAKWIIPNRTANGRRFIERFQGKQHMMKDEKDHIQPWRPYQLFVELKHPAFPLERGFTLTGSICFDSTDIKLSADLKDKSDAYLVSALNQDISTFDSMIDSLYYHMYQHVILVNCGEFGGSVAKAPYKNKYDKLITHVHGKEQVSISSFEINMFDFRSIGKYYRSNKQIKTKPAGFNNV